MKRRTISARLSLLVLLAFFFPASSGAAGPPVNLYLHLDKSIYQTGETIWFTGWILNRDIDVMRAQNTLYTVLVDATTRKPVLQERFVIKDGIGKESLPLPDSLIEGDYWMLAYTNAYLEQGPQPVFRQLISLRTSYVSPFRVSPPILEPKGDTLKVSYKISTSYSGLASGGSFKYTVFGDADFISSGEQTIDPFGQVTILLDAQKAAGKELQLTARISREGQTKNFTLPVTEPPPAIADTRSFHPPAGPSRGGPQALPDILATSLSNSPEPSSSSGALSPVKISIQADSAEYQQRSKVTLHIRIRDSTGNRLPANFSLAVVATKRLKPTSKPTIAEYANRSDSSLMLETATEPQIGNYHAPDDGYVLCDGIVPKTPVSLTITGNVFATLTTDSSGRFELPQQALVTPPGGINYLTVAEKTVDRYQLNVKPNSDTLDKQLAALFYTTDLRLPDPPDTNESILLSRPNLLKAAVVKKKIPNGYDYLTDEFRSNRCDTDFICVEQSAKGGTVGMLNCPFGNPRHPYPLPGGRPHQRPREKPVEGEVYAILKDEKQFLAREGGIAVLVTYHCLAPITPPFVKMLRPVLLAKSFPHSDAGHIPLGSGLQSTVYWNYALSTFDQDEVTVSFYTTDMPGSFTCILQGVSPAGAITQRSTFAVRGCEN